MLYLYKEIVSTKEGEEKGRGTRTSAAKIVLRRDSRPSGTRVDALPVRAQRTWYARRLVGEQEGACRTIREAGLCNAKNHKN